MIHQLRPYQQKGEYDIRVGFRSHNAQLYVLPTGAGKTHTFTSIATKAAKKGHRSLIVVHRSYLWKQTSKKLHDLGADHGIIAPGHTMTNDYIQVASVDTLVRRLDRIQKPDIIIFDEAHHVIRDNKWGRVAEAFPGAKLLGVTATPCRTSGQGLGAYSGGFFENLIIGPQLSQLIEMGYISKFKLYGPEIGINMDGVRRTAGDFSRKDTIERVDKKSIVGSVPEHYKKICPGMPAIAFCVSVKHAEHVAAEFNAAGINAAAVSGKTSEKQRDYYFNGLASGLFQVLCSCDLVSEGFDVPVCGCAICLRPTESTALCLQQWGRALRVSPDKEFSFIIDHVGNYHRHGFPDEIRQWDLDSAPINKKRREEESKINVRACPNCFTVHEIRPVCPECGHVYVSADRTPEQVAGELQEIETLKKEAEEKIKINKINERRNAKGLDDLIKLGEERGYKPGYAYKVWESRLKKRLKYLVNDIEEMTINYNDFRFSKIQQKVRNLLKDIYKDYPVIENELISAINRAGFIDRFGEKMSGYMRRKVA